MDQADSNVCPGCHCRGLFRRKSIHGIREKDFILHKEEVLLKEDIMRGAGERFVGELDPQDPVISPVFGEMSGLPPVHLYSADRDPLHGGAFDP